MKNPTRLWRLTRIVILVGLISPGILVNKVQVQTLQPPTEETITAPDFELPDLNGKKFKLSAYRGYIIVINFWETWCPACIKEMPSLNRLVDNFKKEKKVLFWAISHEDKLSLQEFLAKYKFNYHHFYNGLKVRRAYNVQFVPVHMVIDQRGKIRYSFPADEELFSKLSQGIKSLLNEAKPQ